jgi:phosphoribosylanthranilate isomerase
MFRVKICGITRPGDATLAAEAGADAIGLNFYPKSPRCCTIETAQKIAEATPPWVVKVGVFVNATAEEIRAAATKVPLDVIQLHGTETPDTLRSLRPLPFIKAFGLTEDLAPLEGFLSECHQRNAMPRMLLVDAMRDGQLGGTGKTIDWELLKQHRASLRGLPLALAGGLKADNVAAGILAVHPWAVDVASGVESEPGVKDAEQVRLFVSAALAAFSAVNRA